MSKLEILALGVACMAIVGLCVTAILLLIVKNLKIMSFDLNVMFLKIKDQEESFLTLNKNIRALDERVKSNRSRVRHPSLHFKSTVDKKERN